MKLIYVGAVLAAVLCSAGAASASDYYGLAPGDAEVRVSPSALGFAPHVGVPLHLQVIAHRPGPTLPNGKTRHIWLSYHVHGTCAATPHADKGKSLGTLTAIADGNGHLLANAPHTHEWKHPGQVRFCVWLARRHTVPIPDYVEFYDDLFAASFAAEGSFAPHPYAADWGAAASFPFTLTYQPAGCNVPPTTYSITKPSIYGIYEGGFGGGGLGLEPGCPPTETISLAGSSGQALGTLGYSFAEAATSKPTKSLGACFLEGGAFNVAEATAFVNAVGCHVRSVINRPSPPTQPWQPGEVYDYEQNGGRVELAPKGSAIDLIVNSAP